MSYPTNKPAGIYNLREYDFGLDDPKLIPLDEYNFKRGFRNKDESLVESVPDAHQANWLYNYFNQHINYCENTADENKNLLATKVATPTTIGQIKVGYGLDITNTGVLSVSKGVAEDARIISYDLPVGTMMFWAGTNPPEYFIEPAGQTLLRTTYSDLYQYAVSNNLIGDGKLFGEGDGSTTFTIKDLRNQFIKIGSSSDVVGRLEAEGLPNITGTIGGCSDPDTSGAFYQSAHGRFGGQGAGAPRHMTYMDASRSSSIYGKSTHVTPRNVALKLILKAKATPPNKTVPTGSIMDYTGTSAPDGFIIANGAELSRTTFADLYTWAVSNNLLVDQSKIPSTAHAFYGTGNGTTTFTIPDLRGVFRRGADLQSDRGASTVGTYQPDGLPNIKGSITITGYTLAPNNGFTTTGFVSTSNKKTGWMASGFYSGSVDATTSFDASKSSSVYNNNLNEARVKNVSLLPILKY